MTEAERFLQEKLNPPKPVVAETTPALGGVSNVSGGATGWWFLKSPVFSGHRKFWFVGFILVIFLANFLIAVASGLPEMLDHRPDDDDIYALCFSMITSITFWIPVLYLVYWAFGRKTFKVVGWIASVWMVGVQLYRIGLLFNMRYAGSTEIISGIVVALIGFLGVAAVVRNLVIWGRTDSGDDSTADGKSKQPRILRVDYHCPECNKMISTSMSADADFSTSCPSCEKSLQACDIASFTKEPVSCQLARVVFYIMGVLAVISGVGRLFTGRFSSDSAVMFGELIGMIGMPILFFAMAGAIKKGKTWVRIVLLILTALTVAGLIASKFNVIAIVFGCIVILPTVFVFFPRSNDWFLLNRIARKQLKAR